MRIVAALGVGALVWAWAVAQYPYLLPFDLTVSAGAGASITLKWVLAWFGVAVVTVIPLLVLLYTLDQRGVLGENPMTSVRDPGADADPGVVRARDPSRGLRRPPPRARKPVRTGRRQHPRPSQRLARTPHARPPIANPAGRVPIGRRAAVEIVKSRVIAARRRMVLAMVDGSGTTLRPRDVALTHVLLAAVPGVVAVVVIGLLGPVAVAPLIGWDVSAATFLAWTWLTLHALDGPATKRHAVRDDPTRTSARLTVLLASAATLVAVGFLIVRASDAHGSAQVLQAALAVGSVVMSWLVVHTTYMLRYAVIYHTNAGGVDFNQDEPPRYTDFAYLAFTIGMTFQVSDTPLTSSAMRRNALRHALLSYLYGTFIIAATINLIAGLNR